MIILFTKPLLGSDVGVARLTFAKNKWVTLHYLLQAQCSFTHVYDEGKSPSDDSIIEKKFFLKRSRIILKGQVTKNIDFFMETEDFNVGEEDNTTDGGSTDITGSVDEDNNVTGNGTVKNNVFTQSAFINFWVADELKIAVGLILLPFMHHSRQSAISTLGVNYNTTIIPLSGYSNVSRDTGIEARGLLLEGLIDYKIGVFQGLSKNSETGINHHDHARLTGRIQINLLDPEDGFFYSGNYLGKKKILSFGGGIDFQKNVYRDNDDYSLKDYLAWTVDLTIDSKITKKISFALQGAYLRSKNNPNQIDHFAYFVQSGILILKTFQPVIKYYNKVIDTNGKTKISHASCGINYFIEGHNANIKTEYAYPLGDNTGSGEKKVIIQCQIFI